MTGAGQRVAIITGGSRGIGACPVAAYRRDWAVAANSRTIKPSEDGAVPTKRLHTFSAPGCASSRLFQISRRTMLHRALVQPRPGWD